MIRDSFSYPCCCVVFTIVVMTIFFFQRGDNFFRLINTHTPKCFIFFSLFFLFHFVFSVSVFFLSFVMFVYWIFGIDKHTHAHIDFSLLLFLFIYCHYHHHHHDQRRFVSLTAIYIYFIDFIIKLNQKSFKNMATFDD